MDHSNDIPAAPGTLDPDANVWPDKPAITVPGVHTLPLTFGGELTITEHDGDFQLRIEVEGGHYGVRLSVLDVWGVRTLTGTIVTQRANQMDSIETQVSP